MKPGLIRGKACELNVVVTREMCPHFDGQLVHPVFATWELVHQMEVAGRKVLVPHLEEHEEGMGAHISVDHKSPALLDSSVTITAEVESCSPRQLTCLVEARCGERVIASGRFVQIILAKSRVAELLARHATDAAKSA